MVDKGYSHETRLRKKEILRRYLQKHPTATCQDIRRDTTVKVERIYTGLAEAYLDAGLQPQGYLLRRNRQEQIQEVIDFIRKHPQATVTEIQDVTKVCIPRVFKSILKAYELAGVPYPKRNFGHSREKLLEVIYRAKAFEEEVIQIFSRLGFSQSQVRTEAGIIDCLLTRGPYRYVIEIKDYRKHKVGSSEIKQLLRYMRHLNVPYGFLVCPLESAPQQRNIYKEGFVIRVLPVKWS